MQERYAKLTKFAEARQYGTSTVRKWISEGMPHIGSGRYLRIMVPEAEAWITAREAPKPQPFIITAECMQ